MDFKNDLVTKLITLALDEDVSSDDVTSKTFVDPGELGIGTINLKQDGVVCGLPLVERISEIFSGHNLRIEPVVTDGTFLSSGTVLTRIHGPMTTLLTLERIYLNFIQRLSGIATLTAEFVSVAGKNIILDTRKTTPGLRLLEKYAVVCGGGRNHRMNVSEMILVKNNHIDAVDGDFILLKKKLDARTSLVPLEVEVRGQKELEDALSILKPQIVMLDNYSNKDIEDAVGYTRANAPETKIEVSGGMNRERVEWLATKFEDLYISIGALTTQATNIDISMKIEHAPSSSL